MNPRPGVIVPHMLRRAGFTEITRTQLILPTFWRDPEDLPARIRNGRTGEICYMNMSEVGDRVSSLMLGFWEEIFGEWDDDVEDLGTRNKLRRKEAGQYKPYGSVVKVWARKKQ